MKFIGITARRKVAGAVIGSLLGAVAAATIAAPSAVAAPQGGCSAGEVADTVSATWSSARQYLNTHPGANQVVMGALNASHVRRPSPMCAGTSPPIRVSTTT